MSEPTGRDTMSEEAIRLLQELSDAICEIDGRMTDRADFAQSALESYIERIERERDDAQASLSWCLAPVPDDDPLRPLGSYLADAFDEDQWLTVEPLLNGARKRIAELEAENARLRADAERYRWLFEHDEGRRARFEQVYSIWYSGGMSWREALDAARKAKEEP